MTFFRGHKSAFVADFVNFAKNNALKSVELLAPAKDLQAAVAAVDYGADAVYLGGPSLSLRSAGFGWDELPDAFALARAAGRTGTRARRQSGPSGAAGAGQGRARLRQQRAAVGRPAAGGP